MAYVGSFSGHQSQGGTTGWCVVEGNAEIQRRLRVLTTEQWLRVKKLLLAKGGTVVKSSVLAHIAGTFHGKPFKDYMGRVHQPGTLAKSIACVPRMDRQTGQPWLFVRARAGKAQRYDAYYAFWLERGTSKMGARAFMRPALEQSAKAAAEAAAEVGRAQIEALFAGAR